MATEITLFVLLMTSCVVALIAKRLDLPYTVTLVVAGIGLGAIAPYVDAIDLDRVALTPDVLFHVFLPILLFEASFHLGWAKLRANARAILLLAIPGVVLSVVVGGFLAYGLEQVAGTPIPLAVAFLLSAILAATDPVSVVALFKELGVPERLALIVEGESLLNDAVGVVAFTVCAAILGISPDAEPVTGGWLLQFLFWEIGIGLLAGVGVGLLVSWATTLVDDHLIEIMLTTVAAFGSYLVATLLHASPILAVVASGVTCGNVAARYGMTAANRVAVESFWEYCVFAANGFVFLLLGKEVELGRLLGHSVAIVCAWLALTLARVVVVLAVERALSGTSEKLPPRWTAVLSWGGLRGALSMVLALGVSSQLADRRLVVDLTFGVVVLTILVQGPTMTRVLRWAHAIEKRSAGSRSVNPPSPPAAG
jgi:CPA1 family monovalent cation:H+ antiporter